MQLDWEFVIQLFVTLIATMGIFGVLNAVMDKHYSAVELEGDELAMETQRLLERCDWQNEIYNHIGPIEYIKRLEEGRLDRVYYTSGKMAGLFPESPQSPVIDDEDFGL